MMYNMPSKTRLSLVAGFRKYQCQNWGTLTYSQLVLAVCCSRKDGKEILLNFGFQTASHIQNIKMMTTWPCDNSWQTFAHVWEIYFEPAAEEVSAEDRDELHWEQDRVVAGGRPDRPGARRQAGRRQDGHPAGDQVRSNFCLRSRPVDPDVVCVLIR